MNITRPFLKWAGGKHRQVAYLSRKLPKGRRLVEPFVGSGAVFMGTDYPAYLLADGNRDLIDLFQVVKEGGEVFIEYAKSYFTGENNSEWIYYANRSLFNDLKPSSEVRWCRAALFLYLNRHGFNGLCRYNAVGEFNVPFGRYRSVYFPEAELRAFHQKANERDVEFLHATFGETFTWARPGDVVYCDPPFVPRQGAVAAFTAYTGASFGVDEHAVLAGWAEASARRGIPVVIHNQSQRAMNAIYRGLGARLAFRRAGRSINANGAERRPVREVVALWPARASIEEPRLAA